MRMPFIKGVAALGIAFGLVAGACSKSAGSADQANDGGVPCLAGETACLENDVYSCVDGHFQLYEQCAIFNLGCRLVFGRAACEAVSTGGTDGDTDTDVDTDTNGDTGSVGDVDADGDGDGDTDGDGGSDGVPDRDTGSHTGSDRDTETADPSGSDSDDLADIGTATETVSSPVTDTGSDTTGDTEVPYCEAHFCWRVPPTNQSDCSDDTAIMTCPTFPCGEDGSPAFCGQDAQYPHPPRTFSCYSGSDLLASCPGVVGVGETVMESLNGLVWERGYAEEKTWFEAHDYCDTLTLAGYDDWRLPGYVEYTSIFDHSRVVPITDVVAFPGSDAYYYWISQPFALAAEDAGWNLNLDYGNLVTMPLDGVAHARCVRGGNMNPVDEDRYPVFGDAPREWVLDRATGLEWQLDRQQDVTWEQALRHCEAETAWGESDEGWRLPSISELGSLLNHGRNYPAMDFPYTEDVAGTFWSSTTMPVDRESVFGVDFTQGYVWTIAKGGAYHVRCVRGGL